MNETDFIPMNVNDLETTVNKGKPIKLTNYEKILRGKAIINENVKTKITFSKPILTLNDKPLIYPRTINVIQGKSGTHKSRLAEHICSVLLRKPNHNLALLGMQVNEGDHSICYVDTERNLAEQYPYSLQQIKLKAGYNISDDIMNFDFITLIEIERTQRFHAFREYLEKNLRETYKGHIFVILDVLTDLVENFNDPKDSLKLIDLLNSAINTYDVTFLCIIHENPFQDKARGHLGTELLNKSSTALSINFEKDKDGNDQDVIKIQFLKSRSAKRIDPIYVKYSQDRNCLVFAEADEIEKAISMKDKKANIFDISSFMTENIKREIPKQELIRTLSQEFQCTARTIEDRLKDLLAGKGINTIGYALKKVKRGKETYFTLETYIPPEPEKDIFED